MEYALCCNSLQPLIKRDVEQLCNPLAFFGHTEFTNRTRCALECITESCLIRHIAEQDTYTEKPNKKSTTTTGGGDFRVKESGSARSYMQVYSSRIGLLTLYPVFSMLHCSRMQVSVVALYCARACAVISISPLAFARLTSNLSRVAGGGQP